MLKWACGIASVVWAAPFGALWILRPPPPHLREFTLVAFAVFGGTFFLGWIVALLAGELGEDSDGTSAWSDVGEVGDSTPVASDHSERSRFHFGAWWFGLAIMASVFLKSLFPLTHVTIRDVFFDARVDAQLLAAISVGWIAARLLFAADDRGWIE
jgi:hypothetical protein